MVSAPLGGLSTSGSIHCSEGVVTDIACLRYLHSLSNSAMIKAVISILHYRGKCTTGFSSNCVEASLNCD